MDSAAAGRLRVIIDSPRGGSWNMGVDEALLRGAGAAWPYTLRLYRWRTPTVSLGYAQPWREGFDADVGRRIGVALVRRRTGGRAVIHADELTYSVVGPATCGPFAGGIQPTYRAVAEGLLVGLRSLGADVALVRHRGRRARAEPGACFGARSRYEIAARGRKLLGSAQRRERGRVLQHGSLPLGRPCARQWAVLGPSGAAAAADSIGLWEVLPRRPGLSVLARSLARGLAIVLGLEVARASLSRLERRMAQACARRYRDPRFTYRR